MNIQAFNQDKFYFEIPKFFKTDCFTVLSFKFSTPYGFEAPYNISVRLHSRENLDSFSWLNKNAALIFQKDNWQGLHGIITKVEGPTKVHIGYEYTLNLASPLETFKNFSHQRTFINKSVIEIITEIFKKNGWSVGSSAYHFHINTNRHYKKIPAETQYLQNDYEYLDYLLSRFGLFIHFAQQKEGVTITLIDEAKSLPNSSQIKLDVKKILNYAYRFENLTSHLCYAAYDPNNPHSLQQASSSNRTAYDGDGLYYYYDEEFENVAKLENKIAVHQRSLDAARCIYTIECESLFVTSGQKISIESDNDTHPLRGEWIVFAVDFEGHQDGAILGPQINSLLRFKSIIKLIPVNQEYAKPYQHQNFQAPLLANLHHNPLDDKGHYNFVHQFEKAHAKETQIYSPATPYLQSSASYNPKVGLHFPNQPQSEVLLHFLNGNINNPFIVGAPYSPPAPNVVNSQNSAEHIIKTPYGHQFSISDSRNNEKIEFKTPARNILLLDATKAKAKILLSSHHGKIHLSCALDFKLHTAQNMKIDVGNNHEQIVKLNYMLKVEKKSYWQANTNFNFYVKSFVKSTSKNNLVLNGRNIACAADELIIKINKNNCVFTAIAGSIGCEVNGNIRIKAEQSIRFSQSGALIALTPQGLELNSQVSITLLGNEGSVIKGEQIRSD